MFTFGIFSTHIPYLIFLGFYLSYFLFSYHSDTKKENFDDFVSEGKHILCDTKVSQNTDCAFYIDFLKDRKDKITVEVIENIPVFIPNITVIPGPGGQLNFLLPLKFAGLVVSRPPPSYI
ncbi:hypothetical protein ACUNWD_10145 [Sunxiuqinia sp. A32]|uniref:hypothetical protein n=1 Tax=Sunxiuqinia sp. A32 TaxID=3461496 RepID=UPI0040458DC9